VPVVFAFADPQALTGLSLPADVTGTTHRQTLRNVVLSARAIVPNLKRIALVGTRYDKDPFRPHFSEELSSLAGEVEFINLLDLPLSEVEKQVAVLPDDAAVFYSSLYATGSNTTLILADVVPFLARVSNRPIVTDNPNHIGRGSIGGIVPFAEPMGAESARRALRILDGEAVSQIPITGGNFTRPVFDWRQLQRWGVSEAALPPGSEIRFKRLTIWEQYRWQMIAILVALLLQACVISWLLFERYRRRRAELEARGRMLEVIHLNRTATAGALSASIAHELNQPLGAILINAEAADILLNKNPPDVDQVKEIIGDIRHADQRATEIMQHLRKLLKKTTEIAPREFDLSTAISGALHILSREAEKRDIALSANGVAGPLLVRAEPIHLEQVLLNLISNAMDALNGSPPGNRTISIQTALNGGKEVEVSVTDTGRGIPPDKLNGVFETFYTTKQEGTGLGLSIARTIVETYGGKIWAEHRQGGGAVFRFTLPSNGAITTNGGDE
jgi:signal transduction histidine kinase